MSNHSTTGNLATAAIRTAERRPICQWRMPPAADDYAAAHAATQPDPPKPMLTAEGVDACTVLGLCADLDSHE